MLQKELMIHKVNLFPYPLDLDLIMELGDSGSLGGPAHNRGYQTLTFDADNNEGKLLFLQVYFPSNLSLNL